jgi:very-short-patch-repair endonuclease/predicted transcriptional regulator of viral defense system
MRTHVVADAICEALAAEQQGLISRAQAIEAGLTKRSIGVRLDKGRWTTVLPSVYRMRPAPVVWLGDLHAAYLWAGPESVISHRSAAALHKLSGYRAGPVEISCAKRLWRVENVTVHTFKDDDRPPFQWIEDLPTTRVNRTLWDLAAVEPMARLAQAFDDAYRRDLFALPQMANDLLMRARRGRNGTVKIRTLVASRDAAYALTESELEGRMLGLLKPLGIDDLEVQHQISDGANQIARVDFASPSRMIVIEVDGWRYHRLRQDLQRDNERERRLTLAGWHVIRFVWDDVVRRPAVVVADVARALSTFSAPTV